MTDWYEHLHTTAEGAATADLPIETALQAVRDGYSSIEADRVVAEDQSGEDLSGEPRLLEPTVTKLHGTLRPGVDPASQVGQTLTLERDGQDRLFRITEVEEDPDGCGYPGCVELTAVEAEPPAQD